MRLNELNTKALGKLTDEEFLHLSGDNPHLRMERNPQGNIVIMAPTSSETGFLNLNVATELVIWNRITKRGYAFDSSTGFTLPNSAIRSPDASLILKEKWENLPIDERKRFAHICPDFVIEIVSTTDDIAQVHQKMNEWIEQGASLGWLIDFDRRSVQIFKREETYSHPFDQLLKGEFPVEGFEIHLPSMLKV